MQQLSYGYDPLGNMTWREDRSGGGFLRETFGYDNLQRLTSTIGQRANGVQEVTFAAGYGLGNNTAFGMGQRGSSSRLARKAAEAEAAGFPHGVSVTTTKPPTGTPCSSASCYALEDQGFAVIHTPTRRDQYHHTVQLPRPVTPEAARAFNETFGR